MIQLCSLSDKNFLAKGLALYESLSEHTKSFTLHYLCMDDESYSIIKNVEHNNIIAYHLDSFLENDSQLAVLKEGDYKYFCWTLASYFTNYLMSKDIGSIAYIDSDIFFYDDFKIILDEIGNRSVGVFRHRQYPMSVNDSNGKFNVGVVYFKDDDTGIETLNWWSDAVLYKKYPHLAGCGDQKYLDAFLVLEDKLYFDENIGHGSPWEWQLYDFGTYNKDGCIQWDGVKQKLIFSHFSHFEYDIDRDYYNPSTTHYIFTPANMYTDVVNLKKIYDDYYQKIKKVVKKYSLNGE